MYTPFYREIRPKGWLRRQLEIQARGLSAKHRPRMQSHRIYSNPW